MFKLENFKKYQPVLTSNRIKIHEKFLKLIEIGLKPYHILYLLEISQREAEELVQILGDNPLLKDLDFSPPVNHWAFAEKAREKHYQQFYGKDQKIIRLQSTWNIVRQARQSLKLTIFTISTPEKRKRDLNDVMHHYTRALDQDPTYIEAIVGLGFCYVLYGYYHAAFELFNKAKLYDKSKFEEEFDPMYKRILCTDQYEDFLEVEEVDVISPEERKRIRTIWAEEVKAKQGNKPTTYPYHMSHVALLEPLSDPNFMGKVLQDMTTFPQEILRHHWREVVKEKISFKVSSDEAFNIALEMTNSWIKKFGICVALGLISTIFTAVLGYWLPIIILLAIIGISYSLLFIKFKNKLQKNELSFFPTQIKRKTATEEKVIRYEEIKSLNININKQTLIKNQREGKSILFAHKTKIVFETNSGKILFDLSVFTFPKAKAILDIIAKLGFI